MSPIHYAALDKSETSQVILYHDYENIYVREIAV